MGLLVLRRRIGEVIVIYDGNGQEVGSIRIGEDGLRGRGVKLLCNFRDDHLLLREELVQRQRSNVVEPPQIDAHAAPICEACHQPSGYVDWEYRGHRCPKCGGCPMPGRDNREWPTLQLRTGEGWR